MAQLIYRVSIIRKEKMDMRRQSVIPVTDCEWRNGTGMVDVEKAAGHLKNKTLA